MSPRTLDELERSARALDASDPLRRLKEQFLLPEGLIYLDGNSLGPLSGSAEARTLETLGQWQRHLIGGWIKHRWIDLPSKVGAKIGSLIGASNGSVMACDSTSVNLFKALACSLDLRPGRTDILSTRDNFPTDLYMVEGMARWLGTERCRLRIVEPASLSSSVDSRTAAVLLSHVNFRTGELLDLPELTRAIHGAGALAIWDLAHSAGVLPVDLEAAHVDLAVGCGYKYLNGGPGAPAWIFVHPRHHASFRQPLSGWMGHAEPFAFETGYRPADGPRAALCGTPNVLSLAALDGALDIWTGTSPAEVRAKSLSLTGLFMEAVSTFMIQAGLRMLTPADPARRGSQVALAHADAYPIVQALIARGVVGDFREPDILRFGFSPLPLSHHQVVRAARQLRDVLLSGEHRLPEFSVRAKVT